MLLAILIFFIYLQFIYLAIRLYSLDLRFNRLFWIVISHGFRIHYPVILRPSSTLKVNLHVLTSLNIFVSRNHTFFVLVHIVFSVTYSLFSSLSLRSIPIVLVIKLFSFCHQA